jgi:hypothetical protein
MRNLDRAYGSLGPRPTGRGFRFWSVGRCHKRMDYYGTLSRDSDRHKATVNPDSLRLSPTNDSQEALQRFQSIASMVFAHEGDGYEIVIVSSTQTYPFDLCEALLLSRRCSPFRT